MTSQTVALLMHRCMCAVDNDLRTHRAKRLLACDQVLRERCSHLNPTGWPVSEDGVTIMCCVLSSTADVHSDLACEKHTQHWI